MTLDPRQGRMIMLLAGTLLFIGVLSGLSTYASITTGHGDDTVPDRDRDPEGHAKGNRFGVAVTIALLLGALISFAIGL
jgi:hypothetical protein